MKKIFIFLLALSAFFFVGMKSDAYAVEYWNVTGNWKFNFEYNGAYFEHSASLTQIGNDIDGYGGYPVDGSPFQYHWNIDTGSIANNEITLVMTYDLGVPACTMTMTGDIALNGTIINGQWEDNCFSISRSGTWTSSMGTALFNRRAEITNPDSSEVVSGDVEFRAFLIDNDNDNVQWAVRKGTCAMGTGTIWGNVDGHNDIASWLLSQPYTYNFSITKNVNALEEGMYCFIFNPTEDLGESNIRLTTEFYVDSDNDGATGEGDLCLGSVPDANVNEVVTGFNTDEFVSWGQNRWLWEITGWVQRTSVKNNTYSNPQEINTLGCTCKQILTKLEENGIGDFLGHWKYGCSSSILEHFEMDYRDGEIDGIFFLETLTIPANSEVGTVGTKVLDSDYTYTVKVSGTADAQVGNSIFFDAEYSNFPAVDGTNWVDGVTTYEVYTTNLLDLKVNGNFVNWGAYNPTHIYETEIAGTNNPIFLNIYDAYYPNNTGSLSADIFVKLY